MSKRREHGVAFALGLIVLIATGCSAAKPAPSTPPVSAPSTVTAVKFGVDADGIYQISGSSLREVGFDLNAMPRKEVNLSSGGYPVPFEWVGEGNGLGIHFEGKRLAPDSYTPRNVYWLERSPTQQPSETGPRPQPTPTLATTTGIVTATLRLEEDHQYDPQATDSMDRWYWQTIFAPAKVELQFAAPGVQDEPAGLRIDLIAKSSAAVNPDHRLLVFLNGKFVSDAPWDGEVPHTIAATIPAGVLKPEGNQLLIEAPGDTGAAADSVQLQRVDIAYPSSPAEPPAPREPASIEAALPSSLPDWRGGADLVIVTVPEFRDALRPLVEARTKQGLRVAVIDVQEVYDAFTHGRTAPQAIQALMRYAREHWEEPAPRYLLLAGDASYDALGRTKGAEADIIPTHDVYTTFSGWTGSDVWYALPDDRENTMPAFAVGRFPGQTAEQLTAMVQKTLSYESQAEGLEWRSDTLLLADNDEPGFAEETNRFAAGLAGYRAKQVTVEGDGSNARTALVDAFKAGTGLVGYFGHGSVTLWGKEKVFDVAEAAKLANKDRLPIVFTVTCLSGYFEHPATVSLGETLLRNANGGAVAALVPSSAAVLTDQKLLAQGLAKALSQPPPRALGDIVHDAQLSLPQHGAGVREILLTFNLLGDPSLLVRR